MWTTGQVVDVALWNDGAISTPWVAQTADGAFGVRADTIEDAISQLRLQLVAVDPSGATVQLKII